MAREDVVIRSYRLGDEVALNAASNRARSASRTLDEWAWSFPVHPGPRAIVAAWDGDEVVAQIAAVPCEAQIGGKRVRCLRCVDAFSSRDRVDHEEVWQRTIEDFTRRFAPPDGIAWVLSVRGPQEPAAALSVLPMGTEIGFVAPRFERRAGARSRRTLRSFAYRLELARDWEPGLDLLWERVRHSYPVAVARNAAHGNARLSGHPTVHHHRFMVFPRLSLSPVGFAAFTTGHAAQWVDLLWDHDHPGVLELLAHVSARLAAQSGADREEIWLGGDSAASRLLERVGFEPLPRQDGPAVVLRVLRADRELEAIGEALYLTMADADPLSTASDGCRMNGLP